MAHLTYLALLVGCLVVTAPLELLLHVRVYARWRRLLVAVLPASAVFVAWTLYAIAHGHWRYSSRLTLGVRFPGGLPVEEVGFFLVVPVCAVLALEAVRRVTRWDAGYPALDDSPGSIAARKEPTGSEHRSESPGADRERASQRAPASEERNDRGGDPCGRARSGTTAEATDVVERGADRGAGSSQSRREADR